MAGDWIKIEISLPDKPEVWEIAGMLSIDSDAVVGKLLRVWSWFDLHTTDGNAVGVSFALIDRIAGVTGFAEAMSFCGWLEQKDRNLSLPKFSRHNGKTAKNRALTNDRVAKHRKSNDESNAPCNADDVAEIVSKTVTREEKRRVLNTPLPPEGEGDFQKIWNAYPNRQAEDNARRVFAKLSPTPDDVAQMLAQIALQSQSDAFRREDGRFIPKLAKWLREGWWKAGGVAAQVGEWHETRSGVELMAEELGMSRWDEMTQWHVYKASVIDAASMQEKSP